MTGRQGSSPESIVREGLRGEAGMTNLCRKEGIHPTIYSEWRKAFLEAGKRQLNGETIGEADSRNGVKIPATPRTSSCPPRGYPPEPGQGP
jgi:transposase-like protein